MELTKETRWSRHYADPMLQIKLVQSRFADGTAAITIQELENDWHLWDLRDKLDFAHAVTEAKFDYLPDVYRFIIREGGFETWSAIASWVVRTLPREEYLDWLIDACKQVPVGEGEKLYQAMALTQSAKSVPVLKECLQRTWADRRLMAEDTLFDKPANDAAIIIECLRQLDYDSPDLWEKYEALSHHPINLNKQGAINRLSMFFKR